MHKQEMMFKWEGAELANRLFYQARNLAIESMLLRLENALLRQGFDAHCEWVETSFSAPHIVIKMFNPKKTETSWAYGSCTMFIDRVLISAPEYMSKCYYKLKDFNAQEYWSGKQPKKLLDFRKTVKTLYDSGHLAAEVEKLNFPFDYTSHSPF